MSGFRTVPADFIMRREQGLPLPRRVGGTAETAKSHDWRSLCALWLLSASTGLQSLVLFAGRALHGLVAVAGEAKRPRQETRKGKPALAVVAPLTQQPRKASDGALSRNSNRATWRAGKSHASERQTDLDDGHSDDDGFWRST